MSDSANILNQDESLRRTVDGKLPLLTDAELMDWPSFTEWLFYIVCVKAGPLYTLPAMSPTEERHSIHQWLEVLDKMIITDKELAEAMEKFKKLKMGRFTCVVNVW